MPFVDDNVTSFSDDCHVLSIASTILDSVLDSIPDSTPHLYSSFVSGCFHAIYLFELNRANPAAFRFILQSLSCTAADFNVSFFTEFSVDDVYPQSSVSFSQVFWDDDSASKCSSESTYPHNYLNSGTFSFTITIYSSNNQSSCRPNLDQSIGSFKTRTNTVLDSFSCYDSTLLNLSSRSSLLNSKTSLIRLHSPRRISSSHILSEHYHFHFPLQCFHQQLVPLH
ncbi:hypothetical protein GEMRC1_006317 [Eukaryota sp. GEM-RC1]